jgi:cyclic nucleotide gated channel alpha 3
VFFIVDIAINFRTTYTNTKTGLEVWNPKKIAKHYVLGGKFIIDLLSSIPFDTVPIESISFLNVIGMLKIVRIVRISKIIRHLNVVTETKTVLKTLQLLFNLLLYIHLLA